MMSRKIPIHLQITDTIRARIVAGRYRRTGLPRELTLMEEFKVSRHTIRAALQKLVLDGLIERRAGAGTFVSERSFAGVWEVEYPDELVGKSALSNSVVLESRLVPSKSFPTQAAILSMTASGKLLRVVRLLIADEIPCAVAQLFVSSKTASKIPLNLLSRTQLIHLIERFNGISAVHIKQSASASVIGFKLAHHLKMAQRDPALVLHRTYTDVDHRPIMHAEVFCHPLYFPQILNFKWKSF